MSMRGLLLSCCILFAATTLAQKQTPPEGGKPKDFSLPAKQTFTLDNGLKATLVSYGTLPKVTVRVVVGVGNINEAAEEVWLSDLTGDLMKEGTTSRSAEDIAREAARMGGDINISVTQNQTSISGDVLSEFGPEVVELLADIAQNPLIPEKELGRLKNDRLRQLSIERAQPRPMVLERFLKVMYPDHPYGRLYPTQEMIQNYSLEKIQKFYSSNFGASRTRVYVAGRFDPKGVEAAIRKAFGGWARGSEPEVTLPKPVTKRAIYLIDRPGAAQSTIYMGLPTIDPSKPDYLPLLVTNSLLGGSFASRITSNIRENKGYTYSPFSTVSVRYRDAYWAEIADVTTDVTGPSLKEIFFEIDRLQSEPPSQEELKGIQNYLAGTFVLNNSSRGGIIGQLAFLDLHGLGDSYLTDYVKNVYSVAPKNVQRIAQTYIRDKEMTIVIAGDRKKIAGQVAAYGTVVD